MHTDGRGPLAGVRIIDITTMILGPVATMLLADMGAEVIHIEPPEGDAFREVGDTRSPGMSAAFLTINRNKSSVVLDLKSHAGLEALLKLAETADVLVHNMRQSAADRLGLGYAAITARKPDIIYAAGVGFGTDGPYCSKPAYDDIIQGLSGVAGLPAMMGEAPAYFPTVVADKVCGYALAGAVAMALYRKAMTGKGERLEVPMFETMVQFNLLDHLGGGLFAGEKRRYGYTRMFSPYHRPVKTRDGYICIVANTDRQWKAIFNLIGAPELAHDPRFRSLKERIENVIPLYRIVHEAMDSKTTHEWLELLDAQGVPCGAINMLEGLVDDPHLSATGFFSTMTHPTEGDLCIPGIPVKFASASGSIRSLGPGLGEHTLEILRSLGYDDDQVEQITGRGNNQ
ncbi:CaiB/BaiF CoA transferase family protein [Paraburkholderia sediminicola]|uniref:CaiB/BaiF CoA transferase family protein n=1 Tax=Paraburkholderia sediminicola TaxID=458836 RepID=UPI000E74A029